MSERYVVLKVVLACEEQLVAWLPAVGLACQIRERPHKPATYKNHISALKCIHDRRTHTSEGQREAGHSRSSHDQELVMR